MVAARWADDVRDNPTYHRGPWHYVNFPVIPPGQEADVHPPEQPTGELLTTLKANIETLSSNAPDADKAVALCWVLHQVGDLHQPLHVVALYDKQRPDGDRGGNSFFVRAKEGGAVINLHSLWDGLILGSQTYRDAGNVAIELRLRKGFARDQLKELAEKDLQRWAKGESFELAKRVAYKGGTLASGADRADGPVLPDGYLAEAKGVAERQVVLAGYRIADVLETALK